MPHASSEKADQAELVDLKDSCNLPSLLEFILREEAIMPNTMGVLVLFAIVFVGAILWATRGHCADAEGMGDVTGHPGKMS
jgi:hypothetical protein